MSNCKYKKYTILELFSVPKIGFYEENIPHFAAIANVLENLKVYKISLDIIFAPISAAWFPLGATHIAITSELVKQKILGTSSVQKYARISPRNVRKTYILSKNKNISTAR